MEEKKFAVGQHVFIISNNSFVMKMESVRQKRDWGNAIEFVYHPRICN